MPDENRFAGLSDVVENEEAADGNEGSEGDTEETGNRGRGRRKRSESREEEEDSAKSPNIVESADSEESSKSVNSSNNLESGDRGERSDREGPANSTKRVESGNSSEDTTGNDSDHVPSSEHAPTETVPKAASDASGGQSREKSLDSTNGAGVDEGTETLTGPAFDFEGTAQHSVYVRPETWQQFDDVQALVDARLRTEYGLRDLTGREFHDAALRVAADHETELVKAIVALRRED